MTILVVLNMFIWFDFNYINTILIIFKIMSYSDMIFFVILKLFKHGSIYPLGE